MSFVTSVINASVWYEYTPSLDSTDPFLNFKPASTFAVASLYSVSSIYPNSNILANTVLVLFFIFSELSFSPKGL